MKCLCCFFTFYVGFVFRCYWYSHACEYSTDSWLVSTVNFFLVALEELTHNGHNGQSCTSTPEVCQDFLASEQASARDGQPGRRIS